MQTLPTGSHLQHATYRIDRVLGQGGFGITYLATDVNLQRKVAIKEFFPKDFCDRDDTTSHVTLGTKNNNEFVTRLKAKFLKEARNIAQFDHPNIIRIFAAFEENNTAYYVMEYIEGESLHEKVKREGPISDGRAINYIAKVGSALDYVHARRINHLDVKPANIMIRRSDDTPLLIDFGLSKQYDKKGRQTSTTPTGISHGFAPLEQYNPGGVSEFSPQTDVYSLAATLYYILSGEVPPQAPDLAVEGLRFPSSIPARLINPISKAMSAGKIVRHETVAGFVNDIKGGYYDLTSTIHPSVANAKTIIPEVVRSGSETKVLCKHKEKKKGWRFVLVSAVVAPLIVGAVILAVINNGENNGISDPVTEYNEQTDPSSVNDMDWESPLGSSVYSGEVAYETIDGGDTEIMVPNGKGFARIISGKYAGATYDGNFVSGQMEGEATYMMKNGDVFTGTFHRNEYEEGKYVVEESGEYFEGTFKDRQPYKGKWYSASGKLLEEIK